MARIIGRNATLSSLGQQLTVQRLVTISGPGGIGKTTLALALADQCGDHYAQGAVLVDLAPVTDGVQVPAAVASALGVAVSSRDATASLMRSLRDMDVLVVLDNCEHVIDGVAGLVDQLLAGTSVSILAKSREPIHIDGEWTHRLAPLGLPLEGISVSVDLAMPSPAVELFVERAAANSQTFALTEDNVAEVCTLARHLDGLPLAVELVAARVASLGVRELSSRIEDHLSPLLRWRRASPARRQTLAATLEWSYQRLSASEQVALRRLSVFRSTFGLQAACGVVCDERLGGDDVTEAVLGLATKSLVSVDARVGPVKYRLLDTTRAFAARKLREAEGDVLDAVLRRHALEMQKKLTVADADYDGMSRAPWRAAHGGQIEDIRAALDWCFSESGDLQVGIQVMVNALPLHELGLLAEQTERIERALAYLHELTPPRPDLELRLILKLSWPSLEPGWSGRPTLSILSRTMELAERVADTSSRIGALHCAWLAAFVAGDYPSATKASEGALKVARDSRDQAGVVLSERLLAQCRHFMGDHEAARQLAERTLARESYRLPAECASVIPRRVSMRIILARILWIEGRPDSAARMAEECLAMAEHAHNHAQLQTLGFASIPIAIWRGDTELAEDMVDRMRVLAQKGDSPFWGSWARSFESVLEVMQTTSDAGSPPPRMPTVPTINAMEVDCIASVAPYRHHPVTLHRLSSGACGWCSAELLRKQGEHLSSQGEAEAAERQFTSSMAVAARQNALAWELRAALSLAHARIGQGRRAQAHALVAPLYARFQEGLDTSDLRAAQSVLSS